MFTWIVFFISIGIMNCRFPFNCIANICNKIYTLQYKVPLFYDKYRKNRKKRRQCNDCQRFFIQIIFRSSELISRHSDRCTIRPVTISELGSGLFPLAAHQLQRHRNGLHAVALAAALEAHVIRIAHLLERPETVHVIVDGSVLAGHVARGAAGDMHFTPSFFASRQIDAASAT